jgi:hypothetical protein
MTYGKGGCATATRVSGSFYVSISNNVFSFLSK